MVLSKAIAAKVSAYYTGWVDPEEFAEFAEKGLIYRQRHHVARHEAWGFFAMGKGDKVFPMDKLTDCTYVDNLAVVLPYDALSSEIISVLSSIETARQSVKSEDIIEIDVVADVVTDASTGELKYGCLGFDSIEKLIAKILDEFNNKHTKQLERDKAHDISGLSDTEIRSAVKRTFKTSAQ